MLRFLSLFVVVVGASESRMRTKHLPPWLLSGPDGGNCQSVVGASVARVQSPTLRARDVYQSCWLHRPRDALSVSGSGCAQLARLWHLAVHYHPATSAESFCNSLRDLMPDPVPEKKEEGDSKQDARRLREKPPAQESTPAKMQKADAPVSKTPTLQEKLKESQKKLHEPYEPAHNGTTEEKVQTQKEQPSTPVQSAPSVNKLSSTPKNSTAQPKVHLQATHPKVHLQGSSAQEILKNCVVSVQHTLRGLAGDSPLADIAGGNLGEAAKAECQRLHPGAPPKMCSRFSAALVGAAEQGPPVDANVLCNRLLDDHHHSNSSKQAQTKHEKPLNKAPKESAAASISPITTIILPAAPPSKLEVPAKLPPMREIPMEAVEDDRKPLVTSPPAATTTTSPVASVVASDAARILGAAAAPLRALSRASSKLISKLQQFIAGQPNNHTASLLTAKVALAKVEQPEKAETGQKKSLTSTKSTTTATTTTRIITTTTTTTTTTSTTSTSNTIKAEKTTETTAAATTTTTTTALAKTVTTTTTTTTVAATTTMTTTTTSTTVAATTTMTTTTTTTTMPSTTTTTTTTHARVNSTADAAAASFFSSFESRYAKPHENSRISSHSSTSSTNGSDPAASFLSGFVARYQNGESPSAKPHKTHKKSTQAFVQLGADDAAASFLSGFEARYQGATPTAKKHEKHESGTSSNLKVVASPEQSFVESFLQRW